MMFARKRKYGVLAVAAFALMLLSWQPARTAPAADPADEVLSKDAVLRDADGMHHAVVNGLALAVGA